MRRILLALFLFMSFVVAAHADKGSIVLHPGDSYHLRFDIKGKKIRLAEATKEANDAAQVIIRWDKDIAGNARMLRIENKLPRDLLYKLDMRSLTRDHQMRGRPTPVVAGKMALDAYPVVVEELELFDFKLDR